jgi:hypothetical protein
MNESRGRGTDNFGLVLELIKHLESPCCHPKHPEQNLSDFWLRKAKETLSDLEAEGDVNNAQMLRGFIEQHTKKE